MANENLSDDVQRLLQGLDYARLSSAQEEKHRREKEQLLQGLVEIADSLRALESHTRELHEQGHTVVPHRSVQVMLGQMLQLLERQEVRPMNAAGHPLDLELHEVVGVREDATAAEDTVLEEVVFGYFWKDRPLRRAKVVVAALRADEKDRPVEEGSGGMR